MHQNYEKEKLLVEYLISSDEVFTICSPLIKETYFLPELQKPVEFIKEYYKKFSGLPQPNIMLAECGIKFTTHELPKDTKDYCFDSMLNFCKQKAMEHAIQDAVDIISKKSDDEFSKLPEMFREVLTMSLNKELGIDVFGDDIAERLKKRKNTDMKIPSGYIEFDKAVNGPKRRSIIIFCGGSGGGKSLTLQNFAYNYYIKGKSVLYLSLELYDDDIDERMVSMITGLTTTQQELMTGTVIEKMDQAKNNKGGNIQIKYMKAGTKISELRGYLKEFELHFKKIPDVLVVDYLDILSPDKPINTENVSQKDKYTTEELRSLGVEFNCLILTASQLNRAALDKDDKKEIGQQHIAGGLTKIYTADAVVAVNLNKKTGDFIMEILKLRAGIDEGKKIYLKYDIGNMRLNNPTKEEAESKFKPKSFNESMEIPKTSNISKNDNYTEDVMGLLTDDYDN